MHDHDDWPCHRRDAHQPHPIDCDTCQGEGRLPYMTEMGIGQADDDDMVPCLDCRGEASTPCPGVKAHPATMAGRRSKREQ